MQEQLNLDDPIELMPGPKLRITIAICEDDRGKPVDQAWLQKCLLDALEAECEELDLPVMTIAGHWTKSGDSPANLLEHARSLRHFLDESLCQIDSEGMEVFPPSLAAIQEFDQYLERTSSS